MKKILLLIICGVLLINMISAECKFIYSKYTRKNPDFVIIYNLSDLKIKDYKFKSAQIQNYLTYYYPFNKYTYVFYSEDNLGDCINTLKLNECESIPVSLIFDKDFSECGQNTQKEVIVNLYYTFITIGCDERRTILHEFSHAIGDLKDLSINIDNRSLNRKTLMHYSTYEYYLYDWQKQDILNNPKLLKWMCKYRQNNKYSPSLEDINEFKKNK